MDNLILKEFKEYHAACYPKGCDPRQTAEIEQSFVMGAFTAFNIWIAMGDKDNATLEKQVSEMYKFFHEYKDKRVNELMKQNAHKFD